MRHADIKVERTVPNRPPFVTATATITTVEPTVVRVPWSPVMVHQLDPTILLDRKVDWVQVIRFQGKITHVSDEHRRWSR